MTQEKYFKTFRWYKHPRQPNNDVSLKCTSRTVSQYQKKERKKKPALCPKSEGMHFVLTNNNFCCMDTLYLATSVGAVKQSTTTTKTQKTSDNINLTWGVDGQMGLPNWHEITPIAKLDGRTWLVSHMALFARIQRNFHSNINGSEKWVNDIKYGKKGREIW